MEEYFTLQKEDGTEQLCRVLFTFDSDEHSYVLFTLVGEEDSGLTALRFITNEDGEMIGFEDIETDEEWAMVEEVMNTLVDEFNEDQNNYITITDEDGEEIVCRILHRFEIEGYDKQYLFYGFVDEESEENEIFASAFIANEEGIIVDLLPIETDEEWVLIEEELKSLQKGI